MQKLCAILLLIPLAALSIEWAKVPSFCARAPRCETTEMSAACHTARTCCQKQKRSDRRKDNSNTGCASCLDCPLCYLVTFQPFCRFEFLPVPHRMEYTVMPNHPLSGYSRQQWKPPDSFLLS